MCWLVRLNRRFINTVFKEVEFYFVWINFLLYSHNDSLYTKNNGNYLLLIYLLKLKIPLQKI